MFINQVHLSLDYIKRIKEKSKSFIFLINSTLSNNPYITNFLISSIKKEYKKTNKLVTFIKSTTYFYMKQVVLLLSYIIGMIIYKIYYNKQETINNIIIDIFFLVDNINNNDIFTDKYFDGLYETLDKQNIKYTFLARLYGINKNPFKLIKFFKILNEDQRSFLFEYDLINIVDLVKIFIFILIYPFKTLKLLQQEEENIDKIFNQHLLIDIKNVSFEAFSRYVFAKKLARKDIDIVYSWSEFQVIERAFNYGIRTNNKKIKIVACQLFINYEIYFNTYIDNLDYELLSSPHEVMVNGEYYIKKMEKIKYKKGVSLRYKELFNFVEIISEDNILVLGSYIVDDTINMLEGVSKFDNIVFKSHPAIDISKFEKFDLNMIVTNENIYKLFKNTKIVITTASGTALEAVACGISVIIVASKDNFTANPLVEIGKGQIWDIAFSKDEIEILYNKLVKYKNENKVEIQNIGNWYKNNFFIEPTEENIIKVFELNIKKD